MLDTFWATLIVQVCNALNLAIGGRQILASFAVALLSIWQAGDMFLHMRFGISRSLRWSSRLAFTAVAFAVAIPLFFLSRISIAIAPATYHSASLIASMVILLTIGLFINIPITRLSQSILVLRVALSYPPDQAQSKALNRNLSQRYIQYARVLTLRKGCFIGAAYLVAWQMCVVGFSPNATLSNLRDLIAPVPHWVIILPAYLLAITQVFFHPVYLSIVSETTVVLLILTGYLAGINLAWFIFPAWMSVSKFMHILAALESRRKEAWWDEFLIQHGFVPYLGHRVLAGRGPLQKPGDTNRLELGGRVVTEGILADGGTFILYEATGTGMSGPDAYTSLVLEFLEAYAIAQKRGSICGWFRYLLIRPSTLTLPIALEFNSGQITVLHLHSEVQGKLLTPGEIDPAAKALAEDLKRRITALDPAVFHLDHDFWWRVSGIPDQVITQAYTKTHTRIY